MYVVVTGASRGIGLELTTAALRGGDQVLAVARQESSALASLRAKYPEHLQLCSVDLAHPEFSEKTAAALSEWPQVDVLINNAGVYRKGESPEDFSVSFQVNAVVPFLLTKALLPVLRKSGRPLAVQITSLMGSVEDNTSGGSYAYRASKSALNMLNKCLAVENTWLTALVVHPGWVKTDMGGAGAPLEPDQSAAGIWNLIRGAKAADSGQFFDYRGKRLAW